MPAGELVALLAMLTLPVTAPAADGSNVTVSVAVCEGVRTKPDATPEELKPEPEVVTPETVTLELPVFVSVTVNEVDVPSLTLPKLKLDGLTLSN